MVDAIVRKWLREILGPDVAQNGYGEEIHTLLAIFYANDTLCWHAIFYADDALLASRWLVHTCGSSHEHD